MESIRLAGRLHRQALSGDFKKHRTSPDRSRQSDTRPYNFHVIEKTQVTSKCSVGIKVTTL